MIDYTKSEYTTDVLVIGGGIAAVFAAKRAVKNGASVTLVDKGSIGRSGQTPFASGVAVFDEAEGHSREKWHEIMADNAKNLNNPAYLDNMMDYSKEIYEEIVEWGATETGFGQVFRQQILSDDIEVIERTMITTLLEEDGKVAGAVGFKLDREEAVVIKAKSVILCTGAGAFKPNGFQVLSLSFDGDAMAYRIGAKISGKEFVDTHAAIAETPAYCWRTGQDMWKLGLPKISEGPLEGGGQALDLSLYHKAHEGYTEYLMRPHEMDDNGEMPSGPPEGEGTGEMPSGAPEGMDGAGEGTGPGALMDTIQVGGASAGLGVHKAEGLFPSNNKCGTNIEGLYAAGDCLSSMLVGPIYNGVGGFAMAGSATQGVVAGEEAASYIKTNEIVSISDGTIETAITEMFAPLNKEEGYAPGWVEHMMQGILTPYYVLYIKDGDRLNSALTNIEFFREHFEEKLNADDLHDLRKAHEVKNMLLNAEMKLKASLFRTESRGNHYREDYPDRNDDEWLAWTVIQKGADGQMELEKFMIEDFEKLVV